MTAGLGPTDGGSLTVDRNALVERWVETFGLDLASPVEGALVVQEVAHVASLVDAAVAAERQRIADELRALLLDRDAFHAWLAAHGLGDPGLGAALAVLMRDLRGTCGLCEGPASFAGDTTTAQEPQDPPSGAAYMESHQPHPENGPTAAMAGGNSHPCRSIELPTPAEEPTDGS